MAEERIDRVVTERGSRVVKRNLEDIGGGARKSADGVDFLKNALAGLTAALSLRRIVQTVDAYNQLQNSLRIAGVATDNLTASTDKLLSIANRTKQDLGSVGTLYSRLSGASKELGASQEQLFQFVEAVGASLAVNNTEAGTASGVLLQLSQAMGGAVIQAQEFNSIIDGARPLLVAAAQNIDAAGGSVSRLKDLVNDGKLTAEEFFQGVLAGAPDLLEKLSQAQTLVGQSLVVLNSQFIVWAGRSELGQQLNKILASTFLFLAENMDTAAKVAVSVAAGFVLIGGTSKLIALSTAAVQALNVAIAANPVGALLIVLTSAITALTLFRDQINLGVDDVTTLGDMMRALGETVGAVFGAIGQWAKDTFGPLIKLIRDWVGEVDVSIIGILRLVAKGVDTYIGAWRGAIMAVVVLFNGLPAALGDLMPQALNVVIGKIGSFVNAAGELLGELLGKIGSFVNAAGELLSTVTEFAGLGKIAAVDLQLTNENEGAARKLGQDIGAAFSEGFSNTNYAQDFLERTVTRAQQIGKDRVAAEGGLAADSNQQGTRSVVPDAEAAKQAAEALKQLQDSLASLIGSYDRVWAAQQEYTEGVKLLEQAEAAGLITGERKAQVIALMQEQLRDAMDPLGALNRELEREGELLKMTADQREVENQLRSIQQDLQMYGVNLNEQELAQLRERLTLLQQEAAVQDQRNNVRQAILGPQQEFTAQLEAINGLIARGRITKEQANAYLVEQQSALFEGTLEQQRAWVTSYEQTLSQIDALRKADLISEQTVAQMKARANADLYAKQLSNASSFFGNLASLSRSENRTLAAIGKAAAVTQATIDGVLAVQKALASAPPPANYALAAAVGVSAAANVASILSANLGFQTGGSFVVGGQGGPDSQMVAFRATPGEKVSVARPEQVRKGDPYEGGGASPTVQNNTRIVNVLDPALVGDYLSTPEGEQVLVNVMRRNSDSVRQIVGGA